MYALQQTKSKDITEEQGCMTYPIKYQHVS